MWWMPSSSGRVRCSSGMPLSVIGGPLHVFGAAQEQIHGSECHHRVIVLIEHFNGGVYQSAIGFRAGRACPDNRKADRFNPSQFVDPRRGGLTASLRSCFTRICIMTA